MSDVGNQESISRKRVAEPQADQPSAKRTPSPETLQNFYYMNNPMFSTPIGDLNTEMLRAFAQTQNTYSPIESTFVVPKDNGSQNTYSSIENTFVVPNDNGFVLPKAEHAMACSTAASIASSAEDSGNASVDYEEEDVEEDQESQEMQEYKPKADVFVQVSGRLSLMGNGGKYDVTLSEIRRRIGTPECLNSSILAAVLRKAKTANNGKGMREELATVGIELPIGRRKQGVTTALTALLEGEAAHLSQDLDKVTAAHYPINTLTEHFRAKFMQGDPEEVEVRRRDLIGAMRILKELGEVLYAVQCPLGDHTPPPFHDTTLQLAFNHYSLVTHGFGVLNQRTWVRQFCTLAEQVYQSMMPPPQQMYMHHPQMQPMQYPVPTMPMHHQQQQQMVPPHHMQ